MGLQSDYYSSIVLAHFRCAPDDLAAIFSFLSCSRTSISNSAFLTKIFALRFSPEIAERSSRKSTGRTIGLWSYAVLRARYVLPDCSRVCHAHDPPRSATAATAAPFIRHRIQNDRCSPRRPPLQLQQFAERFWICHRRFAREIFADVSGRFTINRWHGTNRFVFLG